MIEDGERVAADGAGLQWHMVPIADIELIARNTRGEGNGLRLGALHSDTATARTQLAQRPLQRKSTVPVQLGLKSALCVANLAGASGWSKSSPPALDADRSLIRASIESRSAIWSDPIAMASRRFDSRAEIRDDNCGSPRQM